MPYTLKQAAEATATSKPTILRAIQKGRISAVKDEKGEWQIEPAELHRIYPPASERTIPEEVAWNDTQRPSLSYETGILRGEVGQLRERLASLDMELERERREAADQIADLRRRLDQSEQERRDKDRQLTALLTDQRAREPNSLLELSSPSPQKPTRKLWSRLRQLTTGKP